MKNSPDFWSHLESLVRENSLVVDRKKNSRHPKWPDLICLNGGDFMKAVFLRRPA